MRDFILPDIGEGIVECELVKWLIQEGDIVTEDQPIAEVLTDKALVEIPAPHGGRVTKLYYRAGEMARVHAPLFAIETGEALDREVAKASPRMDELQVGEMPATRDETILEAELPGRPPAEAAPGGQAVAGQSQGVTATDEPIEEFILPDIGEGIVECEVVTWHVEEGETIEEDQPIVDVMTDKALVEITAPKAGRLVKRYYHPQQNARVHAPLFAFVPRDQAAAVALSSTAQASKDTMPASTEPVRAAAGTDTAVLAVAERRRIPASPAVRRLVREYGLRLGDIPGSGKHGRVLKEDVLAFQQATSAASPAQELPHDQYAPARAEMSSCARQGEVRVEPLRGVRAIMARRMTTAAATIPHFSYGDEIDVTELLALREALKPQAEAQGTRLTLMPFVMKALALAIQAYPILNSQLDVEASEIRYQPHCNIGMAVDSRAGLMVPNVKAVERLTLLEIAAEVERLTQAARNGRVEQADLKNGTITISNIGVLGGTYAAPIINVPEVAIVALGKIQKLPRFDDDGSVTARSIMTITWSGDHRILDGGTLARFSNLWRDYLQAPQTMLLGMR